MDKFLKIWRSGNISEIVDKKQLVKLNSLWGNTFDYSKLSPEERKNWARTIVAFIKECEASKENNKSELSSPSEVKKPVPVKRNIPVYNKNINLDADITLVKGISDASKVKFNRLNVYTIRDLIYYFPFRYLDYSKLSTVSSIQEGFDQTIMGSIWESRLTTPGGKKSTEIIVGDNTGNIRAVWFNNPWLMKQFNTGDKVVLSGRVKIFNGQPVFESPEWELVEGEELIHAGRIVPVYPLTKGLNQRTVRKLIKYALDTYTCNIQEFLPEYIQKKYDLMGLYDAVMSSHYPKDEEDAAAARRRLAFDELLILQIGVLNRKRDWQTDQPGIPMPRSNEVEKMFISSLPYSLTNAQNRVINEILSDMERKIPMSRLLQGEVGSGKTVVAIASMLNAIVNNTQCALMAPTEILAEQHMTTIKNILSSQCKNITEDGPINRFEMKNGMKISVASLTGSTPSNSKKIIKTALKDGTLDITVGTHALIQKDVEFKKLGLSIIDEQHRFGVEQRSALRQKGYNPHMLVMTATPIPRTLALTLFGDLDISIIDEMPPGRQIIKTKWFGAKDRFRCYNFIKKEINDGHQAYIICPLVEESESIQAKAATEEFEYLSNTVFKEFKLGLLHGKLANKDKDSVMKQFKDHELDILVSTSVVEVGIDVPNATVMLIESADRFGLSQLHQFRGRVGRGKDQSYCILVADNQSDIARQRLEIIEKNHNGFVLADEDLKLRGPGEFFGTRQSGLPDLKMAKLSDAGILEQAREAANLILKKDTDLKNDENKMLLAEAKRVWDTHTESS